VAQHLADGAAVESYIWDGLAREEPRLTGATRIVNRSQEFGFPPLVALNNLPEKTFQKLRRVLLDMRHDAQGRAILAKLHLDGFVAGAPALYAEVERMAQAAARLEDATP
jgi:phosphonate transport system substrate-binding protein